MEEADQESVADISKKTWIAMQYSLKKEGFREGAASGKESVVQTSFNSGYNEGFKMGYAKGIFLGLLAVLESEKIPHGFEISELQNAPKCIICDAENRGIRNENVKSALNYVQNAADGEINSLKDEYGQLLRRMNLDPDICNKK